MNRAIYLDMDGTIADLYSVPNWLKRLRSRDASPYTKAKPLTNMAELRKALVTMREMGCTLGVISWTSKGSSLRYHRQVVRAKRRWLRKNFGPEFFDEVHIVRYGTPKHKVVQAAGSILYDDDAGVRADWEAHGGIAIEP